MKYIGESMMVKHYNFLNFLSSNGEPYALKGARTVREEDIGN